jgi:hypothetical protein
MTYSPELEVLEILSGEDSPLHMIRALFTDQARFEHAISMMIADGFVQILDERGQPAPVWRARQILADPTSAGRDTAYKLALTELGLKQV